MNKADLIQSLSDERQKTERAIQGIDLEATVYPDSDWTVADFLAHIADWEMEMINALGGFREGKAYRMEGFRLSDLDSYNEVLRNSHAGKSSQAKRDYWRQEREVFKRAVQHLDDSQLGEAVAVPWHPSETMTPGEFVEVTLQHEEEHLEDFLRYCAPHRELLRRYVETGLIQFGRFQTEAGDFAPLAMNFLLLPSFPDLMQLTARALAPRLLATSADRLLSTRATTPLGAVLAVESGIPLTYPYGEAKAYTKAYVIEGAYDVGHPTALLTYILSDAAEVDALLEPAREVGLHIHDVLCLFTLGNAGREKLELMGIGVHACFNFAEMLTGIDLPDSMREHVLAWLQK